MDERACEELLRAARAHDEGARGAALETLLPGIKSYVETLLRGELGRLALAARCEAGDLTSVVVVKLFKAEMRGSDARPLATVLSWIKVTARRHLLDEKKRAARNASDDEGVVDPESPGPSADELLAAERLRSALRRLLAEFYPSGVPLLEHGADGEGVDGDASLASELGISVANLQARRTRMRKYVKAYVALREGPRADNEVATAMSVPLTEETRRIIANVRHHVTAQGRKH